ncbi:MAG TPA: histidine kinase [Gammaproteobacteria bacterium]|nr:histidine kinase [Gammaproteobacteria bacterium]
MAREAVCYFESLRDAAIGEQLADWSAAAPGAAVLAFVAEADRGDIPQLQQQCRAAGVQLLGGMFPELLHGDGFRRRGVLLFRLNEAPVYSLVEGLSAGVPGRNAAIERMAEVAVSMDPARGKGTLLLLFDAMVPTIESWLETLYQRIGRRVYYLGFNAGSETFEPMPCLFDNERLVQDAVLVAALPGLGGGVLAHGYSAPEHLFTATSTQGNRIESIDWRPALEVYAELARREYGVEITRENFYEHAVHFPFGLVRATGEVVVRIPVALDDSNALFCIGEVPENAILCLLRANDADPEDAVGELVRNLPRDGTGQVLACYCAGRRMHDPVRAAAELRQLAARLPVPLAGALTLGEIGSSTREGYPLFHNATLVVADWSGA